MTKPRSGQPRPPGRGGSGRGGSDAPGHEGSAQGRAGKTRVDKPRDGADGARPERGTKSRFGTDRPERSPGRGAGPGAVAGEERYRRDWTADDAGRNDTARADFGRASGRAEAGRDEGGGRQQARKAEGRRGESRGDSRDRPRDDGGGRRGGPPQRHAAPVQAPQVHVPSRAATGAPDEEMRIAKAMARAGLCSRREAERWIEDGRVSVNGEVLRTPARDVGPKDKVLVDGRPLPGAEPTQLWRYYKPRGLVTTHNDPQGRPTVFEALPSDLPRVVSVGRLDFNTEGLLLLTNDGALARHLELPATGWLRRYRVRAHGRVTQADLDRLKDGVEVEGVRYGPVEATLDSVQGANVWLTISIREGKNREVRKILSIFALDVNRLIRVSYGPFQLLDLQPGMVEPVRRRSLADQLGAKLTAEFHLVDTAADRKARWSGDKERGDKTGGDKPRGDRKRGKPPGGEPS